MSQPFRGKTVVIVPASQDSGLACALEFAELGADLFLIDRSTEVLDPIRADLEARGAAVRTFVAGIADADALKAAAADCQQWRPTVHALIACHLQVEPVSLEAASEASWREAVNINLLGPVFSMQAFLPLLKRAGSEPDGAAIVNISSIDGILGNAYLPLISSVKGAIAPLTHVAGNEFAAYGIRVNTVARGMTAAPEQDGNPRFVPLIADTPLGRPARPHDIAKAARFLASPDAGYVTGSVLVVDGGRTAITPGTRRMNVTGSDSPMWAKRN